MEIREFYTHLLDLDPPWSVKAVAFKDGPETVDVYLECEETVLLPCPHCDRPLPCR